jgi:hypothetical protein
VTPPGWSLRARSSVCEAISKPDCFALLATTESPSGCFGASPLAKTGGWSPRALLFR